MEAAKARERPNEEPELAESRQRLLQALAWIATVVSVESAAHTPTGGSFRSPRKEHYMEAATCARSRIDCALDEIDNQDAIAVGDTANKTKWLSCLEAFCLAGGADPDFLPEVECAEWPAKGGALVPRSEAVVELEA